MPKPYAMIDLEPFTDADFDRFIAWIESEEQLIQFAGPVFTYPMTHDQLSNYVNSDKRQVYKVRLKSSDRIIGHCEINLQNAIPRLSRILIGPKDLRNKGIGKHIVNQLLDMIFKNPSIERVDLSVFDWNFNAIASYSKIGFTINEGFETTMLVNGKQWRAYNMVIDRQHYFQSNRTTSSISQLNG